MLLYNGISRFMAPLPLKSNCNFEILLAKVFHLKRKTNKIFPAITEKSIFSPWENSLMFLQTVNFVEISNHAFKWTRNYNGGHVKVGIFTLNMCDIIIYVARWWEKYLSKRSPLKHTCSWHDKLIVLFSNIFSRIQGFLEIVQVNSTPCVTLAFSEPWHILKTRGIFRTKTLGYLEHRYIQDFGMLRTGGIFRTM